MADLYKVKTDNSTFLMRLDINKYVKNNFVKAIKFYSFYTGNTDITNAIIINALKYNVPINIAFSVVWNESRFNPRAYNNNGSTSDRGLFQLNDRHRDWTKSEFYNIKLNTREGVKYLNEMITLNDGDIVYALYCYNAGPTRIRGEGVIPSTTKIYVNKVLDYEDMLNRNFNKWIQTGKHN